jgi:protein TonB
MKIIILMLAFTAGGINAKAQNTSTTIIQSQRETSNVYSVVEYMPEFQGGIREQMNYIEKNIVYPKIAVDSAYSGKCYINFVVDTAGYIRNVRVLKGVPKCPECDKEAVRVIQSMPRWKPGMQDGKRVNVYYNLPISFKLQ